MKNLLLLLLFIFTMGNLSQAQTVPPDKLKCKNFLLKTNRLIGFTHQAVKNGKVYTGNLGKAVRYERYAKKLYMEGQYKKAIHFSWRARQFAVEALKANKAKPTSDGTYSADETATAGTLPSEQEQEAELQQQNQPVLTDEEMLPGNLGLDVL